MGWTVDVYGAHSGTPLGKIPWTTFKAATSLNQGEGATITVPTSHPQWAGVDWDDLLLPTRRTVVISWDDPTLSAPYPQYAGVVQSWSSTYGTGQREYTLQDPWWVLEGRHLIDDKAARPAESVLTFGPAALSTLIGRVAEAGLSAFGSLNRLPMTFPPYQAGTTTLTYKGHNATNVVDAMDAIIGWSSGPDVWFRPLTDASTGQFHWDMMADPNLYADHVETVNLDGRDGGRLSRHHDATDVISRAYVFGEGAGSKTPAGKATVPDQTYLSREMVSKDHRTRKVAPLQAHAERLVAWNDAPADRYTLEIPAHYLGTLRPGMTLRINGTTDPNFPAEHVFRVAGYSFGHTGLVTVDLF